jgi:hypothetical protein
MAVICPREFLLATAKVLILAFAAISAATAQTLTLSMPPGASETFTLRVTNPTETAVNRYFISADWEQGSPNVVFSASEPCAIAAQDQRRVSITAYYIAPLQEVECAITVTHQPGDFISQSGILRLRASPSQLEFSPRELKVGSFAKITFRLEELGDPPPVNGPAKTFRVSAHNDSDDAQYGATIETVYGYDEFTVTGDFPGGCATSNSSHLIGWPASTNQTFVLPPIAAHAETSCLLYMIAPGGFRADMVRPYYGFGGSNADGFEVPEEFVELVMRGLPEPTPAIPVLGTCASIALVLGILALAALTPSLLPHSTR